MAAPDFERKMHDRIERELAVRRWADSLGLRLSPDEVEQMVRHLKLAYPMLEPP